jgi:hypothetical protein
MLLIKAGGGGGGGIQDLGFISDPESIIGF